VAVLSIFVLKFTTFPYRLEAKKKALARPNTKPSPLDYTIP